MAGGRDVAVGEVMNGSARHSWGKSLLLVVAAAAMGVLFAFAEQFPMLRSLFALLQDAEAPVVSYFYRDRENLYLPAWGVRVALFLYPAAFLLALAVAAAGGFPKRLDTPPLCKWLGGRRKYFTLYIAAAAFTVGTAWFVLGGEPHEFDECGYILQGRIFSHCRLWADRPPTDRRYKNELDELNNFFVGLSRLEVLEGDKWFTIYAPLHPLFLSWGYVIKVPWLITPLVGAAVPALLVALAGLAVGRETTPWVAALALTSPFWLFNAASFMSEGTWLPFFVLFLFLYWRAVLKPTRGRFLWAGAALGLAACDREWVTFISALPFLFHAVYESFTKRRSGALWLAAGALPFVAVYYAYNVALTSDPFKLVRNYSRQEHFGFNERHTPAVALNWAVRNIYTLSSDPFGWPLLCTAPLVIYPLMVRPVPGFIKLCYAAVATVFAGNFCIENAGIIYGPRYYMGLYPGMVIITGHLFHSIAARWKGGSPAEAGRPRAQVVGSFFAALVVVNLTCYLPYAIKKHSAFPFKYQPWATERLRTLLESEGVAPALVFVAPREVFRGPMPNDPFFEDEIIYARHQGWRDWELIKLFPGRRYFLCDYDRFNRTGEVIEITVCGQ